jgi:hypothetical protein
MWDKQKVAEGNRILWQLGQPAVPDSDDIRFLEMGEKHVTFELGSGEYHLNATPIAERP